MSDIDWSKPVEYVRHGVVHEVLHTFELNGVRYVVLPKCMLGMPLADQLSVREADDLMGTFRNVRRKVKHEIWVNLYADGDSFLHSTLELAVAGERNHPRMVRREHIEWEADADE
jgi:hypothetical protein